MLQKVASVFDRVRKMFKRNTTLVQTTTGENINVKDTKEHPTLRKMKNNEMVSLTDINLYLSDELDSPALTNGVHLFHKDIATQAVFSMDKFIFNEETKLIHVVMKEEAFNLPITLTIDASRFSELFKTKTFNLTGGSDQDPE